MITDTLLDDRIASAAAELRAALSDSPQPVAPHHSRRTRPIAIAVAATAAIVAGIFLQIRGDTPVDVPFATAPDGPLPYYLPADAGSFGLQRSTTTSDATTFFALYGNDAQGVLVQITELTSAPAPLAPSDCTVRATTCFFAEYPVDNGATYRMLLWQENNLAVSLQSTAVDRSTLLAAAAELTLDQSTVSNTTLGGSARRLAGIGPTICHCLADPSGTDLAIAITAAPDNAPITFLPGTTVRVNGHDAWLAHQPADQIGGTRATLTWRPRSGVVISLAARTLTDEQLVALARTIRSVTEAEWNAIPAR